MALEEQYPSLSLASTHVYTHMRTCICMCPCPHKHLQTPLSDHAIKALHTTGGVERLDTYVPTPLKGRLIVSEQGQLHIFLQLFCAFHPSSARVPEPWRGQRGYLFPFNPREVLNSGTFSSSLGDTATDRSRWYLPYYKTQEEMNEKQETEDYQEDAGLSTKSECSQ